MSVIDLSSDVSFNTNIYLLVRTNGILGRRWPNELAAFNPMHSLQMQRYTTESELQISQCSYIVAYDYIKLSDALNDKLLKQYKFHHMGNCSIDMVYYKVLEADCESNNDETQYTITKATPIYYQNYSKLIRNLTKLKRNNITKLMSYVSYNSSYDDFKLYVGISNEGNIPTVIRTMYDKAYKRTLVDYYLIDKRNGLFHVELPHNKTPIDMGDKLWNTYFHDIKDITK